MAKEVDPRAAWEEVSKGNGMYLDIRTKPEFARGHPPNAVNIEFMFRDPDSGAMEHNASFLEQVGQQFPDKHAQLLVACQSGTRSTKAVGVLTQAGYTQILHQHKGWVGWEAAGLPLEK